MFFFPVLDFFSVHFSFIFIILISSLFLRFLPVCVILMLFFLFLSLSIAFFFSFFLHEKLPFFLPSSLSLFPTSFLRLTFPTVHFSSISAVLASCHSTTSSFLTFLVLSLWLCFSLSSLYFSLTPTLFLSLLPPSLPLPQSTLSFTPLFLTSSLSLSLPFLPSYFFPTCFYAFIFVSFPFISLSSLHLASLTTSRLFPYLLPSHPLSLSPLLHLYPSFFLPNPFSCLHLLFKPHFLIIICFFHPLPFPNSPPLLSSSVLQYLLPSFTISPSELPNL